MSGQGVHPLTTGSTPDHYDPILISSSQVLAISTIGKVLDHAGVPFCEAAQFLSHDRVPDHHGPIEAARGNLPTIRTEGHAADAAGVLEGVQAPVAQALEIMPFPAAQ